jgi:hypothetical protein
MFKHKGKKMEVTNQKSFVTRAFSNIVAAVVGTGVFWFFVVLGLALASVIGELMLFPYSEALVGMPATMLNGQLVVVLVFGATLYLISDFYNDYGLLGGAGVLAIIMVITFSVDWETYFPGIKRWVLENCSTFPWFGIAMAIIAGSVVLVSYYGLLASGRVFDYVRNKIGVYENVASGFEDSAHKKKTLSRILMLWMVVSFVLLTSYVFINAALNPRLAKNADEMRRKIEEQKIERELSEHFPQKIPALVGDQQ